MTTTQIIIVFGSFAFLTAIGLVGYIWLDAKKDIANSVKESRCKERMDNAKDALGYVEDHLANHSHDKSGNVKVDL
jgi:hypothetical protein